MKFGYLLILLVSLSGMVLFDFRNKLVAFYNLQAALKSIAIIVSLLLFADIIGVNWHVFSTNRAYVIGLGLGSENIPIEELVFLIFLAYAVLCIYQFIKRKLNHVSLP